MEHLFVYALAGGCGKRLWPLSRENKPKQFLEICDGQSMLQETVRRHHFIAEPPIILTNSAYEQITIEQLSVVQASTIIIIEPVSCGTMASAIVAALDAIKKHPDACVLLAPTDHHIMAPKRYQAAISQAYQAAREGKFVFLGVNITSINSGYGYIKKGPAYEQLEHAFLVAAFHEKPSIFEAERFIESNDYLWNSGIFVFHAASFLAIAQYLAPRTYLAVQAAYTNSLQIGSISYLGACYA